MAVKENEITKKLTDTHDEDWWIRMVDAAGASKDMLKSLLRLNQSQIDGLVELLATLAVTPAIPSQMAFIQAAGTINGSGLNIGVITDEAGLNTSYNGFYTAVTPFEVDDLGFIRNVLAFDDSVVGESTVTPSVRTVSRQLIFSTLGILYREFSVSGGGWGTPIFMGGTNANYSFAKADLVTFAGNNKLTPGALYRLTDHGNDYGIVLQAASSFAFMPDGFRVGKVPKYHVAGTYDSVVHIGVWRIGIGNGGVAAGNKTYFMGRTWTNLTGNIGTVDGSDEWSLDATNWELSTTSTDYIAQIFGCTYDLANDYISKQWDSMGNILGEVAASDGFLVEYNDWSFVLNSVGVLSGGNFNHNELARCHNNKIDTIGYIYHNKGGGQVYSNDINGGAYAGILGMYIDYAAYVRSNTFTNSMLQGAVMNGNNIESQTFTASANLRIDNGKIVGSVSINAGTFTIPTGATYSAKTIATGMTITTVRENGVTVTGETLIAQYAGWHRVKAIMLVAFGTGQTIQSTIFVNSTDTGLFCGSNGLTEIDNYVLLAVGDVVSIRHKHAAGGTETYTHLSSSFTLEYDN